MSLNVVKYKASGEKVVAYQLFKKKMVTHIYSWSRNPLPTYKAMHINVAVTLMGK